MIRGVRRPDEASALGLSNRLMVRVGALLKKNVALSKVLLESAKPGTETEQFLLAPALLDKAAALDDATLAQILAAFPTTAALQLRVAIATDNFRVLCLGEEMDAGDWGTADPAPEAVNPLGSTLLAPQHGALVASSDRPNANASSVLPSTELQRLKLRLLTATQISERIEALRTLVLALQNPAEKGDVLLTGLSDRDAAVRAEAAQFLPLLGIDSDFASALQNLNHPELPRRQSAMERLKKLLQNNPRDAEAGCAAACALAMLKSETDSPLNGALIQLLGGCASVLSRDRARLLELARIVMQLIAAAGKLGVQSRELDALLWPAHPLFTRIGNFNRLEWVAILLEELERVANAHSEGFLLQVLLDIVPPESKDVEEKLVRRAVDFIGREREEGRDSRAVGTRLIQRGERSIPAICEFFPNAHAGAQKYFLIVLESIFRVQPVAAPLREAAAKQLVHAIEFGSKGVRMSAMECRFAAHEDVGLELREKLARQILQYIGDFTFRSEIESVEASVAQLGLPAAQPLLERLAPEFAATERVRAVRLLGEWSRYARAPKGQMPKLQETATNVLRRLELLNADRDFPDRGELYCALGKVAACPAVTREADTIVTRTLLETARGDDPVLMPRALEGLCHLASARRASVEMLQITAALLKSTLEKTVPDLETEQKQINGDRVFEISGGEAYTSSLPIVLSGIGRIACSPLCPTPVARDMATLLTAKLREIQSGKLIWGPANTLLLINTLKTIAMQKSIFADLRLDIIKALANKFYQIANMVALTEILAADDTNPSAGAALTIGYGILSRRNKDGAFPMDDREEILRSLARIAARKSLGMPQIDSQQKAETLRKVAVDELLRGLRDQVPGAREGLEILRDVEAIPKDLREEIRRKLSEGTALTQR